MVDFLKISKTDRHQLGHSITSWSYKPQYSMSMIIFVIGVIVAGIVFALTFLRGQMPWLRKIPNTLIYVLLLFLGPLMNIIKSWGRERRYTLYDHGFVTVYKISDASPGEEKVNEWLEFSGCTYNEKGVTLFSSAKFPKRIRLRSTVNVAGIYSICRDRISSVHAQKLQQTSRK